jgi:hypothetical protein
MKKLLPLVLTFITTASYAQLGPEITSWIVNTTGATGYNGIESNVLQVQYSTDSVYVSCNSIPSYDIGPWFGQPNVPTPQGFVYRLTRHPIANTGTPIATPLGHIGVWTNGVGIYNAKDAMSYNNLGIWNQNAIVNEGIGFDECLGHPSPFGEYHNHLNPRCLYNDSNATVHSPIIGWSLDGYPVYGAYGYANADGSGGIKRMNSSYQMRAITDRTTLADGTVLTAAQYGPTLALKALGTYIEDFEYVAGLGDLDEHNGRFAVTPDYPDGIYAYYVTIDSTLTAVYPYTFGPTYYGLLAPGNTGPNGTHNTITEQVTTYLVGVNDLDGSIELSVYPNPVAIYVNVYVSPSFNNNLDASLYNATGQLVASKRNMQPAVTYPFDMTPCADGIYFLRLQSGNATAVKRVVKGK